MYIIMIDFGISGVEHSGSDTVVLVLCDFLPFYPRCYIFFINIKLFMFFWFTLSGWAVLHHSVQSLHVTLST